MEQSEPFPLLLSPVFSLEWNCCEALKNAFAKRMQRCYNARTLWLFL